MRQEVIDCIRANRIIAIIRGFEPDICLKLAQAYYEGGIRMIEVTFPQAKPEDQPKTAAAIKAISDHFAGKVMVGAGTVLTSAQLHMAKDAGARYMVAPGVNPALIQEARSLDMVVIPGALTPTEVETAYGAGADFIKVFPAGTMGVKYVKDLRAPLAHIPLLAVGGITPDNVGDFMRVGCLGAGVSGSLTNREFIAAGAWDKITAVAKALIENSRV